MHLTASRKYSLIASANLRRNYLPHIALSVLLLFITPVIFGTSNLDAKTAAIPLEMFIALNGILLLTPVFLPEQQKEIRELVESRYTSYNSVCLVRIIIAILIMLLLISCFVLYMKLNGCEFEVLSYIIGTFAGGFFLGALGLFSYGLSNHIATGYMIPMVYYILNMFSGSEHLGQLYLFSMAQGSFEEKFRLLASGVLLIILVLIVKSLVQKRR